MATKITVSGMFTELDNLTNGKFNNVPNEKKLAYLNRAILDVWPQLMSHCPEVTNGEGVITATSDTTTIDLPSNCDTSSSNIVLVFHDQTRNDGLSSDLFYPYAGKLRFNYTVRSGTSYYLEYTKEPSRYTLVTSDLEESSSIRSLEIIKSQVEHLRDVDLRQGQNSPQAQASQFRANEIS